MINAPPVKPFVRLATAVNQPTLVSLGLLRHRKFLGASSRRDVSPYRQGGKRIDDADRISWSNRVV